MKKKLIGVLAILVGIISFAIDDLSFAFLFDEAIDLVSETVSKDDVSNSIDAPVFEGEFFTVINNNEPVFNETDFNIEAFESYSDLDSLGRVGIAYAKIGPSLMPTEDRGSIGSVKPTGWETIKYDHVSGNYLYNRSHLIGYQLTGENANALNLMTGTRSFNVEGMLPFENMVTDYIKETNNHVMYKVTPVFDNDDLLAKGVVIEALSVEDNGTGIKFNVFVHNIEPGVVINYKDGTSTIE